MSGRDFFCACKIGDGAADCEVMAVSRSFPRLPSPNSNADISSMLPERPTQFHLRLFGEPRRQLASLVYSTDNSLEDPMAGIGVA
jgi:hypothetical protein